MNEEMEMMRSTPSDLLRLAIERNLDVSGLEKIMDMQFRWEAQQAKRESDKEMVGFKSEASLKILKSKTVKVEGKNGNYQYKFPPLDECCSVIIPLLAKHNISHRWDVDFKDPLIHVTCRLTHIAGHSEEVTIPGLPDTSGGKNSIQSIGSTVSYLERYTLLAVCGIAAADMPQGEKDEDAGPNPFAGLSGDEFFESYKRLYLEAGSIEDKQQIIRWKAERQIQLEAVRK